MIQRIVVLLIVRVAVTHATVANVVAPRASRSAEALAVDELNRYLGRMGVKDEIVVCRQGSETANSIKPALPKLEPDGFAIAVRGNGTYLVGADDRGVLHAVYAYLHERGCRWLAPAFDFYKDAHEIVPKTATRFAPKSDLVSAPALKYRKLYVEEGHSHTSENLKQLVTWMPKARFNTLVVPIDYQGRGRVKWDNWRSTLTAELQRRAITVEVGGHGYQNFLNAEMEEGRLFREDPEWFGMDEQGKRVQTHNRVLCSSNREAVAYLQRNVIAYLRARPEIQIFDFWPPDGARWCACEKCKALGTPSDRHALLVSQMSDIVRREQLNVRVECIAYSSYVEPPATPFNRDVLVDFCPINQCFESQIFEDEAKNNVTYANALRAWRKSFDGDLSVYSYYRKYAWCSLPIVLPHYVQKDLQFYRSVGVSGISSYAEPGDWFTFELNHYMLGQLAWNPDANVDSLMGDFCRARYGLAARAAEAMLRTMEDLTRHGCSIPFTTLKSAEEYGAMLATIETSRQQITSERAKNDSGPLQRLSLMLEYAARDLAIQRHRAANGDRAERRKMVDDLAAFLQQHKDDGVFVWHTRMEPPRIYARYGAGT